MVSKLPISELKVNQSFIRNLLTDDSSADLVEIIVEIGRHLKVKIVAEGIEKPMHVDILKKYGCHTFQGFYFSKPLGINDLEEYIIVSSTG
jgi:EAL domain-containing protein (putative c-di-GMP-specific phosphodiesterase class I)